MLGGSETVSGEGHFWSELLMSEGDITVTEADCLPPISNVTQVAVISDWYGSYGSM